MNSRSLRVLVIDDNRLIANSLVQLLNTLGHQAGAVYGPMPAMQLLTKVVPDLIMVDLHMQGVNGIEVCRYVQRDDRLRHIPIIAISSDTQEDLIQGMLEAGAVAFIPKPVDLDSLEKVIETILAPHLAATRPLSAATSSGSEPASTNPSDPNATQLLKR